MTRSRHRNTRSNWTVFRAPVAIAVASGVGLLSALTGDGPRDILSWAALAAPVLTVAWAMLGTRNRL